MSYSPISYSPIIKAYQPNNIVDTMLSSSISSIYSLSPYSPVQYNDVYLSPVSKIKVGPYSTTITTNLVPTQIYDYEIDTGMNDNYIAQKQMIDYMLKRALGKWLFKDLCHILKYLLVENNKVKFIPNLEYYYENKICNDSEDDANLKIDYIEDHHLGFDEMKELLKKIVDELNIKWYDLPRNENIIMNTVEKYLKNKLKKEILRK
jgi:hypothetical protein